MQHRRGARLEIILELLAELVFQLVGELLVEWGLHSLAEPFRRQPKVWQAVLGYLLLGALFGALSLWLGVVPRTLGLVDVAGGAGLVGFGSLLGYRTLHGD